jgi:hypothetical protein
LEKKLKKSEENMARKEVVEGEAIEVRSLKQKLDVCH